MEKSYAKIIIIGNKVVREKVLLVFCLVKLYLTYFLLNQNDDNFLEI